MRSFPLQRYWKAIVSLALVAGLGSKLLQRIDSVAPTLSAPPPVASAPPAADELVTVHAEVDGRVYRIIVGHMARRIEGKHLWSAAVSEGRSPGSDSDFR